VPNLTQAWTRAEASKPHGWTLRGVALGPREVDPHVRSEKLVAWARRPNGERIESFTCPSVPGSALESRTLAHTAPRMLDPELAA
jgi:hypothetical protein